MGSPALLSQLPEPIRQPLIQAFSASLTDVFLVGLPFAIVAFGLALLIPELPLRDTAHVGGAPTEL